MFSKWILRYGEGGIVTAGNNIAVFYNPVPVFQSHVRVHNKFMMRGVPPLLVDWGPLNWLQFNAAHVTSDPTTNISLNSYSWCWSKWKNNWQALTFFSTFRSGISKVKEQIFSEHSYTPDHKELYYTCCHLKLTSFKRFEFIQWEVKAKKKSMVLGLY